MFNTSDFSVWLLLGKLLAKLWVWFYRLLIYYLIENFTLLDADWDLSTLTDTQTENSLTAQHPREEGM